MKKATFLFIVALLSMACNDGKKNKIVLTTSSGNINNLSVVADNDLWQGKVGEQLRDYLAAPVDGLPQQEPLFSISHLPPSAFSGFVRKNRIFLKIQKRNRTSFKIVRDTFARPQVGVYISGPSSDAISKIIAEKSPKIIKVLKRTELREQQRRIAKSVKKATQIEKELGISLKIPTAYRYAKNRDHVFWIRKDIPHGDMDILLYEVPLKVIDKDTNVVGNIIAMRDSIGKSYVPGPKQGSYLKTEEAYAPYLFKTKIDGRFAYETKGTWDVANAFMAGPFINYAVRDTINNRYVILEGFVFKPSSEKRDQIFELESILKSMKFIKN